MRQVYVEIFLVLKGATKIILEKLYATIKYWFPLLDCTGNLPVSSVYNLLVCIAHMCSSFGGDLNSGVVLSACCSAGTAAVVSGCSRRFVFVDLTPCLVCTMLPLIVSSAEGQYWDALLYVSPVPHGEAGL